MRDFRDAKTMAQTLREAFHAKSVPLTHSEALELTAKVLGERDWNTLAARIQSSRIPAAPASAATAPRASSPPSNPDERRKVSLDPAILDGCAGYYLFSDHAVYTVTSAADHLLTRLTGQRDVAMYAQGPDEFFAEVVDAQISFVRGADGQAISVALHQGGRSYTMPRIDTETATQMARRTEEKVKSQSASPGTEAAMRRLFDTLVSGNPAYHEMGEALAAAVRQQLPNLQSGLSDLGAIQSVRFLGVSGQGEDVYTVMHENGASHWRIALRSDGKISTAWVTPGP